MTRDPDPTGFDDIVAAWRAEGGVPQWPDEDARRDESRRADADDPPPRPQAPPAVTEPPPAPSPPPEEDREPERPPAAEPRGATAPDLSVPDPLADEHFVPPEPPPLPRIGPPMLVGLTLIGLGLVLVTFPGWVGVPQVYGLPLGLVAIAAGLGWLVLRLWPDHSDGTPPPLYLDDPDDPDGGAVL